MRWGALAVALILVAVARPAAADDDPFARPEQVPRPRGVTRDPAADVALDVHLDVGARRVRGTATLAFDNVTADPLARVYVWLYPNRFAARPAALDDVSFYWIYPAKFNPGSMRLTTATQAGRALAPVARPHAQAGEGVLVELPLAEAVAPGQRAQVELAWEAVVPERYGAFGCVDGVCTLLGGYAPMLATLDAAGWDLEAPPQRGRVRGTLHLAKPAVVVSGGDPPGDEGTVEKVRELALAGDGGWVPLVVLPRASLAKREVLGVTLVHVGRRAPPPADDARRQTLAYVAEDYAEMTLDVLARAVRVAHDVGVPVAPGRTVVVVEAPLRTDLAVVHPGLVVVSDRMFRIFPAKRFRRYHARELARALYTAAFAARLEWPGASARDRDRETAAAAAYLGDLYTLESYQKYELAQVMLAPVAFIPAIDQLIYAPQVAFAGAYFGAIKDDDPFRDDVRRFNNVRPRAGLYYEKLRDLVTPEQFGDIMRRVVLREARLRDAAEAVVGEDLGWFFRQWGGRYPRVNYAVGERQVSRGERGWVHRITVRKQAVEGDPAPVEPVEVLVVDGAGTAHRLRWDGKGDEGVVTVETGSPSIEAVTVDPRARLPEATPADSPADPEFDNREPKRWTFLYNSFGAALDSQGNFGAVADFSFKRVRDNRNLLRFAVSTSESVLISGYAGYTRRFGPRVVANLPLGRWGGGLSLQRLNDSFAGLPGARLTLSFGFGYDDRDVVFEPQRGRFWVLGARWTVTRFDDTAEAGARGGELLQTAGLSGEYTYTTTPWDGHTVVLDGEGSLVFGDIEAKAQLLTAGGVGALRGYGLDELWGRARVTGHVEYRYTLTHDLDWNLGHMAWLRGIGLAAFVDVGALSSCDDYGVGGSDLFASVGGGIRFFYDNFGVQSGLTAIDFGVPLVRRSRGCLGEMPSDVGVAPFLIYLQFLPPFT